MLGTKVVYIGFREVFNSLHILRLWRLKCSDRSTREKAWYHWLHKKSWITTDNAKKHEKNDTCGVGYSSNLSAIFHTRGYVQHDRMFTGSSAQDASRTSMSFSSTSPTSWKYENLLYLLQSEWIFGNLYIGMVDAFADEIHNVSSFHLRNFCFRWCSDWLTDVGYLTTLGLTGKGCELDFCILWRSPVVCAFGILWYFCNINRFQHSLPPGAICSSKTPGKFVFQFKFIKSDKTRANSTTVLW